MKQKECYSSPRAEELTYFESGLLCDSFTGGLEDVYDDIIEG